MEEDAVLGTLYYKIWGLDGTLVVDDLHHLHDSTWHVVTMQPGQQGGSAIGDFTIPLYGPKHDMWSDYWFNEYSLIVGGMRIEGYWADSPAGAPAFTGIIVKLDVAVRDGTATLTGLDWIAIEHMSLGLVGEFAVGTTGGLVARDYIAVNEYRMMDDMAGHGVLNGTWNNPGAAWGGPVADEGIQAWTEADTTGVHLLQHTTNFSSYSPVCVIEAWFHFSPSVYTAGSIGELGLIVGFDGLGASALNGYILRAALVGDGGPPDTYHVLAEVGHFTAGTGTIDLSVSCLTGLTGDHRFQITAIGDCRLAGKVIWRIMINGKDVTAFVTYTASPPTGYVGVRWPGSANVGQVWMSQFVFTQRRVNTKWMKQGNIDTSTGPPAGNIPVNGQSFLDMITFGASIAGCRIRKRTAADFSGDFIDLGVVPTKGGAATNVGRDLTGSVKFQWGRNLVDLKLEGNLQSLATEIRMSGDASSAGGGNVNWVSILNAQSIGVEAGSLANTIALTEQNVDVGTADALALRRQGENAATIRSAPNQAKTVTILRTPDVAEMFHELDLVELDCPPVDILDMPALVVGYTFRERSPFMDVQLDEWTWRQNALRQQNLESNLEILNQIFGVRQ